MEGMLSELEALEAAGHAPKTWLLERCVARAERAGAREALKPLLQRLFRCAHVLGVGFRLADQVCAGGQVARPACAGGGVPCGCSGR